MFAKREDWQGLERSDLLKYFNDCGHFPTQTQIDEYWDLLHRCECCCLQSLSRFPSLLASSPPLPLLFIVQSCIFTAYCILLDKDVFMHAKL
jgi:hypothetical protein